MRLTELHPKWINHEGRLGVGIKFDDPKCGHGVRLLFENPIDGGDPLPNDESLSANNGGERWLREGTDFETLTIRPSIDGSPECSHFHVTNGAIE